MERKIQYGAFFRRRHGKTSLFFPSLVIFAGALVLMGFREFDVYSLDARRSAR